MQALLDTFGIQPILLVAQIINFLIVFFLLKQFAWKPILQVLKGRQSTIAETGKNAERAQKALDKALDKEKEILQSAQKQAHNIVEDARNQAIILGKSAEDETRKNIDRMVLESQKKIEKQTEEAEKQFASKVTLLASDMLKESLKGIFSQKEQSEVVKKVAKEFKN